MPPVDIHTSPLDPAPVGTRAPIFIVGCPRSGTALLRNLLRAHPNLSFPGESHFIPRLYRGFGDPKNDADARRLATAILGVHWVQEWGLDVTPDDFADCRSYRAVVSRLFDTWARQEQKPRWGDKTPHYVTEIPTLLEIFPDAKILHIYRDGRDVALSWLRVRFEPRNVYQAARLWKRYVSVAREAGGALPPGTYLEVRYESVLTDTRATMERVCRFLGEPFSEAVLAPEPLNLDRGRKSKWTTIIASNAGGWKAAMAERDRVLFESVAGDLLRSLGYESRGPVRRISLSEKAYWHAHQWWRYATYRVRRPDVIPRLLTFIRLRTARKR